MNELTYITAAYASSGILLAGIVLATWARVRRIRKLTESHEA